MLSEREKEKIRLAEICRIEAMEEIMKEKEKKWGFLKYLKFLDNKIVIWLLSLIFAAGGLKAYEDYKIKVTADYNNKEAIDKLDLEISYKFSRLFSVLDQIEGNIDAESATTFSDMRNKVYDLIHRTGQVQVMGGEYLYPEYAHRSLLSLVVEQRRKMILLKKDVSSLDEVIAKLSDVSGYFERLDVDYSDIPALRRLIATEFMLPAWNQYGL